MRYQVYMAPPKQRDADSWHRVDARMWWGVVLGTAAVVAMLVVVGAYVPSNHHLEGACGEVVTGRNYKRIVFWAACLISVFGLMYVRMNTAPGVTDGVRRLFSAVFVVAAAMLALIAALSATAGGWFC
jgi:hypothetical protein